MLKTKYLLYTIIYLLCISLIFNVYLLSKEKKPEDPKPISARLGKVTNISQSYITLNHDGMDFKIPREKFSAELAKILSMGDKVSFNISYPWNEDVYKENSEDEIILTEVLLLY